MRLARAATGILWVCLLATLVAQAKPDFSGKWTLIDPPPNQADSSMTVSQDATTVTIVDPSPVAVLQRVILKLDGTPTRFTMPRRAGRTADHRDRHSQPIAERPGRDGRIGPVSPSLEEQCALNS
jgi:hypothetical protein